MSWSITVYIAFLFGAVIVSTCVAYQAFGLRGRPGALPISLLALAVTEWTLALAGESLATEVSTKIVWSKVQYLGLVNASPLALLSALELARRRRGIQDRYLVALWIVPIATLGLALTNEWHHLIWTTFTPSPTFGASIIVYGHGAWFWVHVAYVYLILSSATLLMVRAALRFRHLYRRQFLVLLVSMAPPWTANAIYLIGPDTIAGLDLTPIGFALTGLMLTWSVRRLQLLDLIPVARDVIIEEMREAVVVLDRQNRLVDINPAARRLLGLGTASAIGRDADSLFKNWARPDARFWEAPGTQVEIEADDGSTVECRASRLSRTRGGHPGRLLILRDITEEKRAQEQLQRLNETLEVQIDARTAEIRAEKERSEAILASVGDGILVTDSDHCVRYVNAAFEALTGYTAEELHGKRIDEAVDRLVLDRMRASMALPAHEARAWRQEVRARRKDGRAWDASLTITPVQGLDGKLDGQICTLRDITDRQDLIRAKDRFIENVSHQFRTPAATIQLYIHLMRRARLSGRLREYVDAMEAQVVWLNQLIEDVMEMTALESGKMVTAWEPVSLHAVVENVLDRFGSQAERSGLALEGPARLDDLPLVKGDEFRLAEALGELVENAVVFTPSGGRVVLSIDIVEEECRWVTVRVADTGLGIPVEEQERVFDRFFRGSVVDAGHIPGTGLGLSIARTIVEAHGGQITMETGEEGSTFTIWLPAVEQ